MCAVRPPRVAQPPSTSPPRGHNAPTSGKEHRVSVPQFLARRHPPGLSSVTSGIGTWCRDERFLSACASARLDDLRREADSVRLTRPARLPAPRIEPAGTPKRSHRVAGPGVMRRFVSPEAVAAHQVVRSSELSVCLRGHRSRRARGAGSRHAVLAGRRCAVEPSFRPSSGRHEI